MLDALYSSAAIDAAKNGTRDLIAAPGASKQLWVYGLIVGGSAAAGTFLLLDSTPTSKTGSIPLADNATIVWPVIDDPDKPYFKCASNTKLQVTLSANMDLDGIVIYRIVDLTAPTWPAT